MHPFTFRNKMGWSSTVRAAQRRKWLFLTLAAGSFVARATCSADQAVHRINCGGSNYTDSEGNLWAADHGFSTGFALDVPTSPSQSVLDDPRSGLFFTERWDRKKGEALVYVLSVPRPGSYSVRLLFADTCACTYTLDSQMFGARSLRNFDIVINDMVQIEQFDPIVIGGWGNVVSQDFRVTTSAETIAIELRHGTVQNPMINGIEIREEDSAVGAIETGVESVEVLTNAPTQAPTALPTFLPSAAPTSPSPTGVPTTIAPTRNPTHIPTATPTTLRPTAAPTTIAPTVPPTHLPSSAPSTVSPTRSPTPTNSLQPATHPPNTVALITAAPITTSPTIASAFEDPHFIIGVGCCRTPTETGFGTYVESTAVSLQDCGDQCLGMRGCLAMEYQERTLGCELHLEAVTHTSVHKICRCGVMREIPNITVTPSPTTVPPTSPSPTEAAVGMQPTTPSAPSISVSPVSSVAPSPSPPLTTRLATVEATPTPLSTTPGSLTERSHGEDLTGTNATDSPTRTNSTAVASDVASLDITGILGSNLNFFLAASSCVFLLLALGAFVVFRHRQRQRRRKNDGDEVGSLPSQCAEWDDQVGQSQFNTPPWLTSAEAWAAPANDETETQYSESSADDENAKPCREFSTLGNPNVTVAMLSKCAADSMLAIQETGPTSTTDPEPTQFVRTDTVTSAHA